MLIPDVHELWARVLVHPSDGRPPYEAIVRGYTGDGRTGATDRDAEWYWFTSSKDQKDGAPAERVKRIVRVTIPGGDTFEGVSYGVVRDGIGDDAPIIKYNVSYLHTPTVVECVDTAWVQPL